MIHPPQKKREITTNSIFLEGHNKKTKIPKLHDTISFYEGNKWRNLHSADCSMDHLLTQVIFKYNTGKWGPWNAFWICKQAVFISYV